MALDGFQALDTTTPTAKPAEPNYDAAAAPALLAGWPLHTTRIDDVVGDLDVPLPPIITKATTPWGDGLDLAAGGAVPLGSKSVTGNTFTLFALVRHGPSPGGMFFHRGEQTGLAFSVQSAVAYPVTAVAGQIHNENLTPFSLGSDTWYAMAMTYSSGQVLVYLNGTLVHRYTEPAPLAQDEPWQFGDGAFRGQLADVRIYDRVLSQDELRSIQQGPDQWKAYSAEVPDPTDPPPGPNPPFLGSGVTGRRVEGGNRRTQRLRVRSARLPRRGRR